MAVTHVGAEGSWRPAETARPLYWWDQQGLERAESEVGQLFQEWSAAWGVGQIAVRCQAASPGFECERNLWVSFGVAGRELAWMAPAFDEAELLAAMFPGAAAFGPLARAVAQACRQDLHARMGSLVGASSPPGIGSPAAFLARAGSGALEARLSGLVQGCILVHPEAASRWRASSRTRGMRGTYPLVCATAALAGRSIPLEVQLEGCELDVRALQGLRLGDVVRLEHALEQPAMLRHGGVALCAAFLGRLQNRKAVELAAGAPLQ